MKHSLIRIIVSMLVPATMVVLMLGMQRIGIKNDSAGPSALEPVVENESGTRYELSSRGIFGPLSGWMQLDPQKENILEVQILDDGSSPGYGSGLLASERWTGRLRNQPLFPPSYSPGKYRRRAKQVDGSTGASMGLKAASRFNALFQESISGIVGGDVELVPLELDLSVDAVTRATPGYPRQMVRPPHLRAEIRRPAFLIPPGTRLLSRNRPVSGSMDFEPIIGELSQITDGVKTSTEFDYVEMDAGPQWIQIDLGATHKIHLVVIWHYYRNPVIYNDVVVQLSDDPEFRNDVRTIYNNDHDNSSGEGAGADSAYFARWWGEFADGRGAAYRGTAARYVRVHTNGGTGMEDTRFVEVEVYGE